MLNQVVIVGRITKELEIIKSETGKKYAIINLAVPRTFKNSEGIYETDFIKAIAFGQVAEKTTEYCKKGDIIGIKGRLQTKEIEKEHGEKKHVMELIAEKVTFLSSRKEEKEGE